MFAALVPPTFFMPYKNSCALLTKYGSVKVPVPTNLVSKLIVTTTASSMFCFMFASFIVNLGFCEVGFDTEKL